MHLEIDISTNIMRASPPWAGLERIYPLILLRFHIGIFSQVETSSDLSSLVPWPAAATKTPSALSGVPCCFLERVRR